MIVTTKHIPGQIIVPDCPLYQTMYAWTYHCHAKHKLKHILFAQIYTVPWVTALYQH